MRACQARPAENWLALAVLLFLAFRLWGWAAGQTHPVVAAGLWLLGGVFLPQSCRLASVRRLWNVSGALWLTFAVTGPPL